MVRRTWVPQARTSPVSVWAPRRQFFEFLGLISLSLTVWAGFAMDAGGRPVSGVALLLGLLSASFFGLSLASRYARLTVGVDRVVARSVVGGYSLRQADVLGYVYVGDEKRPREWFLRTPKGLVPVGCGPVANRLIDEMRAQWPDHPRVRDEEAGVQGAAYRFETSEPAELATVLRMPHLGGEARVRVAKRLVDCSPEHRATVQRLADDIVDPEVRAQLATIADDGPRGAGVKGAGAP